MQFDREKLKAVILYTCLKCKPSQLGAVKLHKVLYFADMLHYVYDGSAFTGATYRKRPLGPTCDQLLPLLGELKRDGAIETRESNYFGYKKKEYLPKVAPELFRFNEVERDLLDDVIEFVCLNNTAKTISDLSHNRAWEMAEFGDILPYSSAFLLFPSQVSLDALDWASERADEVEAERNKSALEGTSLAAFRGRLSKER